jgi:hypothetical protein
VTAEDWENKSVPTFKMNASNTNAGVMRVAFPVIFLAKRWCILASPLIWWGAIGAFALFQDDGKTYAYEKGGGSVTNFTWDDAAQQLRHSGASTPTDLDHANVVVIGR